MFNSLNRFASVSVVLTAFVACSGPCSSEGPCSEGGGSSFDPERVFQHIGCKVWKTDAEELYYSLAVGHDAFEPVVPALTYRYSYDINQGGKLFIDGKEILRSKEKKLLAVNPFGKMEELLLNDAEAAVVNVGDAVRIWTEVVVPRLYHFQGRSENGKRVGSWTCSDKAGVLAYEGAYVEGLRDGEWIYRYPSGKVRAKINYRIGKRHRSWTYFDEAGTLTDSLTWKEDVPVERPAQHSGLGYSTMIHPDGSSQSTSY